jgi:hypothetical protein
MTRIISGTLVTVVVGFSVAFAYLLYQLVGELDTATNLFGSAGTFMYFSVEVVFLALVLFGAFAVVRKKN